MKRRESAAEGADGRPARWRERLGNWLAWTRQGSTESMLGAWVGAVLSEDSVPLTASQIASAHKAYLVRLQAELEEVHLYGLGERQRELQEQGQRLDPVALYCPLNTTEQVPAETYADRDENGETDNGVQLSSPPQTRPLTLLEAAGESCKTLIVGSHGSGKTAFLRYLVLSLLDETPEGEHVGLKRLGPAWRHGALKPLWLDVRAVADEHPDGLTATDLCHRLAGELGIYADQLCNQVIAPGGVLLVVDGLEAAPEAVADFVAGLETLGEMTGSHQNCLLIASEAYVPDEDLPGDALSGLRAVTLAPWTLEQMDDYARGWYAELERREWVHPEEARDLPSHLCSALRRPEIQSLARRPLLMAFVAQLHAVCEIPADAGMFYHALIDLALASWSEARDEQSRDLRQAFDLNDLRSAVAQLAYQGYARLAPDEEWVTVSESDLRTALIEICQDERWETVNELITRIMERPYLLHERGPGAFGFPDRGLQAYVVARYLSEQPELPRLVVELVEKDLDRWQPVVGYVLSRLAWLGQDLPAALAVADALVQPSLAREPLLPDDEAWQMVCLAGESAAYLGQSFNLDEQRSVRTIQDQLLTLIERELLSPAERQRAGRALDRLPGGDPRTGVSPAGILWCAVPAGPAYLGEEDAAEMHDVGEYWIARYPVTNAQYRAFVEATSRTSPAHWQGTHYAAGLGNHPVVNVTWEDANAYCAWLTDRLRQMLSYTWRAGTPQPVTTSPQGWQIRLPTGGEWVKAARGGQRLPAPEGEGWIDNPLPRREYPWGNGWTLSTSDNPGDEVRENVSESNLGTTTPVGMYASGASPYGVLDMAGNVWEWCQDWADAEERYKTRRGGAFRYMHERSRCTSVDRAHPGLGWPYVGFRLVLGPGVQISR